MEPKHSNIDEARQTFLHASIADRIARFLGRSTDHEANYTTSKGKLGVLEVGQEILKIVLEQISEYDPFQVLIEIEGGALQCVAVTRPGIAVELFDHDNVEATEEPELRAVLPYMTTKMTLSEYTTYCKELEKEYELPVEPDTEALP
jgi:hypothetical protein